MSRTTRWTVAVLIVVAAMIVALSMELRDSDSPPGTSSARGSAADSGAVLVDAAVPGLVGACVRVTRKGVPVQTTVVVLDRDLIAQLQAAGVPLQQLVDLHGRRQGRGVLAPRRCSQDGLGTRMILRRSHVR